MRHKYYISDAPCKSIEHYGNNFGKYIEYKYIFQYNMYLEGDFTYQRKAQYNLAIIKEV